MPRYRVTSLTAGQDDSPAAREQGAATVHWHWQIRPGAGFKSGGPPAGRGPAGGSGRPLSEPLHRTGLRMRAAAARDGQALQIGRPELARRGRGPGQCPSQRQLDLA
jgi:hypothetical protein